MSCHRIVSRLCLVPSDRVAAMSCYRIVSRPCRGDRIVSQPCLVPSDRVAAMSCAIESGLGRVSTLSCLINSCLGRVSTLYCLINFFYVSAASTMITPYYCVSTLSCLTVPTFDL